MKTLTKCVTAAFLGIGILVAVDLYGLRNAEAFNTRLEQKVRQHHLIGKPESEVVTILGRPSHRIVYRNGDFTLNYAPSCLLPLDKFQAHFRSDRTLRSIELMDD